MTDYRSLLKGLKAVYTDMTNVVKDPEADPAKIVACGFVAGFILDVLPKLGSVDQDASTAIEAEIDQFLAHRRDRRA